jgi:predicted dehydrogenase
MFVKGATMSDVRFGIVGLGGMGRGHAQYLVAGSIKGAVLCSQRHQPTEAQLWASHELPEQRRFFDSYTAMLQWVALHCGDLLFLHYFHPDFAVQAFHHQLHAPVEKPAGVYEEFAK